MMGEKIMVRLALRIHTLKMAAWKRHWRYSGTSSDLFHAVITLFWRISDRCLKGLFFQKQCELGRIILCDKLWKKVFPIR